MIPGGVVVVAGAEVVDAGPKSWHRVNRPGAACCVFALPVLWSCATRRSVRQERTRKRSRRNRAARSVEVSKQIGNRLFGIACDRAAFVIRFCAVYQESETERMGWETYTKHDSRRPHIVLRDKKGLCDGVVV